MKYETKYDFFFKKEKRKNGIIVHHFQTRLSNYAKIIQLHNTYNNKSAILFQKYFKCNFHHHHAIKNLRYDRNNIGKCL